MKKMSRLSAQLWGQETVKSILSSIEEIEKSQRSSIVRKK
jgi:hypothetical protein